MTARKIPAADIRFLTWLAFQNFKAGTYRGISQGIFDPTRVPKVDQKWVQDVTLNWRRKWHGEGHR